jgi:hypothetical protein
VERIHMNRGRVGEEREGKETDGCPLTGGAMDRSTPSAHALRMSDALECRFDFTFAKSEKNKGSHYSTLKTMKEV